MAILDNRKKLLGQLGNQSITVDRTIPNPLSQVKGGVSYSPPTNNQSSQGGQRLSGSLPSDLNTEQNKQAMVQPGGSGISGQSTNGIGTKFGQLGQVDINAAKNQIGSRLNQSVLTNTTPSVADKPATIDSDQQALLDALNKWIGGDFTDTQAQIDAAQRANDRATGQALADSRAQAGFGGFGLSGASQGMESDIRSKAADQMVQQMLGIKNNAINQQLQGFQAGANALLGQEDVNTSQQAFQAILDLMNGNSDASQPERNPTIDPSTGRPVERNEDNTYENDFNADFSEAGTTSAVTEDQRFNLPGWFDASQIKDSSYSPGDHYFGSDGTYDYYSHGSGGAYYRIKHQ